MRIQNDPTMRTLEGQILLRDGFGALVFQVGLIEGLALLTILVMKDKSFVRINLVVFKIHMLDQSGFGDTSDGTFGAKIRPITIVIFVPKK